MRYTYSPEMGATGHVYTIDGAEITGGLASR
jgi:hypothetical protein